VDVACKLERCWDKHSKWAWDGILFIKVEGPLIHPRSISVGIKQLGWKSVIDSTFDHASSLSAQKLITPGVTI
jgi:hypothetical protein